MREVDCQREGEFFFPLFANFVSFFFYNKIKDHLLNKCSRERIEHLNNGEEMMNEKEKTKERQERRGRRKKEERRRVVSGEA